MRIGIIAVSFCRGIICLYFSLHFTVKKGIAGVGSCMLQSLVVVFRVVKVSIFHGGNKGWRI